MIQVIIIIFSPKQLQKELPKMKEMTSDERMIRVLERKIPDRVPVFEWMIDKKVVEAICPGGTTQDLAYKIGLDGFNVECNYETKMVNETDFEDEWGMIKRNTGESHPFPVDGPIRTMEDVEKYQAPAADKPGRFTAVEKALLEHSGKKALFLHLNDVYSIPSRLMPYEFFLVSLVKQPEMIKALVAKTVDANLALGKEAARRGIKFIWTGDDYAYNLGLMFSPKVFKEIFAPELYRVMQGYKELGLYVIKHTDGDIMSIIDTIIEAGIDCIDPIDPLAGMNLANIKKNYGKKVAIKGNVECAETLSFRTVEDTIAETRSCLEIGMPDGGYILSSSNSIHSAVKPENFLAMVETVHKYGKY
jgi:uroporphyrinogen decarboxylase